MSLRVRLAVALALAAIVPMAVATGVPLIQAGRRARAETESRLDLSRRQAAIWIERRSAEAADRVARAASDLARDPALRDPLLQGPYAAARAAARSLAERHGLDVVEVVGAEGATLAAWPDGSGPLGDAAARSFGSAVVREEPHADIPLAFVSCHDAPATPEPLSVCGARAIDRAFVEDLAGIAGQPVSLIDGSGAVAVSAGRLPAGGRTAAAEAPLAGGWRLVLDVPASDPREVRRELIGSLAGVAPLALAAAAVLGLLLARGIDRPVRDLADRAEAIAREHGGFGVLDRDPDEVRSLTAAFDRMLVALSESERRRIGAERIAAWQEVARRIAHEVKNPLSPIKMAVENLLRTRERSPQALDRALSEESATILEEVESLRRLVDEFSEFARLPAPRKVPCDLREIAAQSLSLYEARIGELGVRVEFPPGGAVWVLADPEQIGRVLKNVLSNALNALESVEERRLSVSLARRERVRRPDEIEVEVRDTGVGLGAEEIRRVFEPYFTTRAGSGGTGLGLAIAQRIATEHDGSLEIRGEPGRGATVVLRLPAAEPPAPHP